VKVIPPRYLPDFSIAVRDGLLREDRRLGRVSLLRRIQPVPDVFALSRYAAQLALGVASGANVAAPTPNTQ